jgi:glycerol-1-phosphate dehydrogenase [NAD(P)+]
VTEVVLGEDAVARLVARAGAEGWVSALVVMDANTLAAAGATVVDALRGAGVDIDEFVFGARSGLLAGLDEAGSVTARLGEASRRPVAVGSGVITDIVRFAAHGAGRDFISVPTAASMDGYASGVAAMQVQGVKVTYPARPPVAIYADPRVAAAAPAELTRAGLGDLLAKATAGVDWLAAHLLYGEPYDADVVDLVSGTLDFAARSADRVVAGEPAAVGELLSGLIGSGTAMALAGSSRPASGCEHHASHFWDLLAAHGRRPHASHGLQVGYATRFAMRLQRFAFGGGVVELRPPVWPEDPLGASARAWLGDPVAPDIVEAVAAKQRFITQLGPHVAVATHAAAVSPGWPASQGQWEEVRRRIAPAMARFDEVEAALDAAGFPREPGWMGLDRDTLRATFRYATRLRARYTAVDFLEGQGVLEEAVEAALAQA